MGKRISKGKEDRVIELYLEGIRKDVRSAISYVLKNVEFEITDMSLRKIMKKRKIALQKVTYVGTKNPRWEKCVFDDKDFLWRKAVVEKKSLSGLVAKYGGIRQSALGNRFISYFGMSIVEARRSNEISASD